MEDSERSPLDPETDEANEKVLVEVAEESEAEEELEQPKARKVRRPHVTEPSNIDEGDIYNLADQDLINLVHEEEILLRHMRLENQIFLSYLKDNDPAAVESLETSMESTVKKVLEKQEMFATNKPLGVLDFKRGSTSSRRSMRFDSMCSINSILDGEGPKINVSQKSDMAMKAMEEIQTGLEIFVKKTHKIRRSLKAELEEFHIRRKDIKESVDTFGFDVLVQAVDPLTQRIPAEKFVRWMDEWLKSAQLNIEKLRLRTASMRVQLQKVSAILTQRREVGENVHAVDFDQLEIENKHLAQKLERKQTHLIELKKMNGAVGLILNNSKRDMRLQQEDYNLMKDLVVEREKINDESELECDKIEEEMTKAKQRYESFRELTKTYRVPEVMEYCDLKVKLNDIKSKLKVWHRRKKIQDITIDACLRQMKTMTGSSKIDRAWLECVPVEETIDSSDIDSYVVEEEVVEGEDNELKEIFKIGDQNRI